MTFELQIDRLEQHKEQTRITGVFEQTLSGTGTSAHWTVLLLPELLHQQAGATLGTQAKLKEHKTATLVERCGLIIQT